MGIFGFGVIIPIKKILIGGCWKTRYMLSGGHFREGNDISAYGFLPVFEIGIVIWSEFFVYVHFVDFPSDFFPNIKRRGFPGKFLRKY